MDLFPSTATTTCPSAHLRRIYWELATESCDDEVCPEYVSGRARRLSLDTSPLTNLKVEALQPDANELPESSSGCSLKCSKSWGEVEGEAPVAAGDWNVDASRSPTGDSPFANLTAVEVAPLSKSRPFRKASFNRSTGASKQAPVEPLSPVTPDSFADVRCRFFRRSSSSVSVDSDAHSEELSSSPRRTLSQGMADHNASQAVRTKSFTSEKQRHPAVVVRKLRSFSQNYPCSFDAVFPSGQAQRRKSSTGVSTLSTMGDVQQSAAGSCVSPRSVSDRLSHLSPEK